MRNRMVYCVIVLGLLALFSRTANAEWMQTNGPCGGTSFSGFAMNGHAIFTGTYGGGVFRSTDNGALWTAVNSGLADLSIRSLAVDGSTIYAGTGFKGIFRSTDNGNTWASANNGFEKSEPLGICALAVRNNVVYAEVNDGLFISTNNGESWTRSATLDPYSFMTSEKGIYAACFRNGHYYSSDNGATWEDIGANLPQYAEGYYLASAMCDADLFATIHERGIFRSTDNGTTWIDVSSDLPDLSIHALAVNGTTLFAGTDHGIYRTTDRGAGWAAVNEGLTGKIVRSLACFNGILFAGTYRDGVFRSLDNGETWTQENTGLISTSIASIVAKGETLLAGTASGYLFKSTDNGATWNNPVSTGEDNPIIGFTVSGTMAFAKTYTRGFFFSITAGSNAPAFDAAINRVSTTSTDNEMVWNGTAIFSEAGPGKGIIRSIDNGSSWDTVYHTDSNEVFLSGICDNATVFFLAHNYLLHPTNRNYYRSTDNGATWEKTGMGTVPCNRFLAVCNGALFAAGNGGILCRSIDNGASWKDISRGLAGSDIQAMAHAGDALFSATREGGVFLSVDNGDNWEAINTGLPELYIRSLAADDNTLYAGTNGCGVWRLPVSEVVPAAAHAPDKKPPATAYALYRPGGRGSRAGISLYLDNAYRVAVSILTISGRTALLPVDRKLGPGSHTFMWDTGTLPAGCYLATIAIGTCCYTEKLPILR